MAVSVHYSHALDGAHCVLCVPLLWLECVSLSPCYAAAVKKKPPSSSSVKSPLKSPTKVKVCTSTVCVCVCARARARVCVHVCGLGSQRLKVAREGQIQNF